MRKKEIFGFIVAVFSPVFFVPFVIFIVFPFFQGFSPEKKLEKLIEEQCIVGNEIAIQIRRDNIRYYADSDYKLVRAAIEGNENAARALRLDKESLQKKSY